MDICGVWLFLCMLCALRVHSFVVRAAKYHQRVVGPFFAVNGDNSNSNRKGKTGWTHSTPEADSDFWEPGPEASRSPEDTSDQRTGWLHYNKGREESLAPSSLPDETVESATESSGGASKKVPLAQRRLQLAMRQQERNHRIISPPSFHACGEDRSIVVTEHMISVPHDRSNPKGIKLDVYFTIVEKVVSIEERRWFEQLTTRTPVQRASDYVNHAGMESADDMILYLQGGPGFGAPTPVVGLGFGSQSSWAGAALNTYSRVVLMDQRGTGRSTPITKQSLEHRFPNLFLLDTEVDKDETREALVKETTVSVAEYMSQFRADNICLDAEVIREALLLPMETDGLVRPWGACLGQSFGGFCLMSYLSQISHPPKVCLFTGGIAPMLTPCFEAYLSLWDRVKERSLQYYDAYPGDIPLIKAIVKELIKTPVALPSGGKLTARRFLQLGLGLGSSPSTFARLHALFQSAFVQGIESLEFSRSFLKQIDMEQSFDDAPIYFWLHESIYADGPGATEWAAHRAYQQKVSESPEFDYVATSASDLDEEPTLFFGEMVFPWMAEDYQELSGVGLSSVANELASKSDWTPIFDAEKMRSALEMHSKAAAAVYYDDLYVDFDCSMKVAGRGGPLEKCKVWITNDFQHSGLRDDGASIFKKLHGMVTGSVRTPS